MGFGHEQCKKHNSQDFTAKQLSLVHPKRPIYRIFTKTWRWHGPYFLGGLSILGEWVNCIYNWGLPGFLWTLPHVAGCFCFQVRRDGLLLVVQK